MKKSIVLAGLIAAFFIGAEGCASRVVVQRPAPRTELIPPPPSPRHVWVKGHYIRRGRDYVWINGHYKVRRRW